MKDEDFERLSPEDRLGDAPLDPAVKEQMLTIVRSLDEYLNPGAHGQGRKLGFVLLLFPFNDHVGRCNFASNGANRADLVTLFKEMIARFEGRVPHGGGSA